MGVVSTVMAYGDIISHTSTTDSRERKPVAKPPAILDSPTIDYSIVITCSQSVEVIYATYVFSDDSLEKVPGNRGQASLQRHRKEMRSDPY